MGTHRVEQDRLGVLTCDLLCGGKRRNRTFNELPERVLRRGGVVALDEVECTWAITCRDSVHQMQSWVNIEQKWVRTWFLRRMRIQERRGRFGRSFRWAVGKSGKTLEHGECYCRFDGRGAYMFKYVCTYLTGPLTAGKLWPMRVFAASACS